MAEKIHINFLGTGSAVPTAKRNHPAVLLQYKDENILFDCGEGTQKQFRIAKLNPCKTTRIFISHWHGDHMLGLAGLIQTLAMSGYCKTLKIYGPHKSKQKFAELVEPHLKFYMNMAKQGKNNFQIELKELFENDIIDEKEFQIKCSEMSHDTPCLAYSFIIKEKNRLDKAKLKKLKLPENSPLLGQLAQGKTIEFSNKKIDGKKLIYTEPQKKITYITDTRENENTTKIAQNSDVLICESTYSAEEEEQAREYSHLTCTQAAEIAKKSKSKKLFLIHLSQRYENPKYVLEEAKKVFKDTKVAEDFDKVEL